MSVQVAGLTVVTLVSGESREITRVWADGAYECPWCWYPVRADEAECGNPACDTRLDAAGLAARRAEQAARVQAAEREASLRRWEAERRAEREAAETALWAELSGRASDAGECIACLRRSYWRSSPRFVRHRDSSNCPNAGR